MRTAVVALLIAIIAAALYWLLPRDSGPAAVGVAAPVPVTGYRVETRQIADRSEALGTLRAQESVEITATVTKRVAELRFDDGNHVQKGQVIVLLEQAEELAELADAREQLKEEEREVRRIEALVSRRLAAANELDTRRTQLARAQYRIAALQARIDDLTIRAPFSGELGLRRVSVGTLVSPGSEITTLDDTSQMKLDFNVPAILLGSLVVGQPVIATTSAFDQPFEGTVAAVDSRVNPTSRSVVARALFANDSGLLRPGMLMTVVLQRSPRQALVVPEESLLARQRRQYVLVIDRDSGEVSEHEVTIGAREPGWAEVTSGLAAGDWIIREGISTVAPGRTVSVRNREALAAETTNVGPGREVN